MKQWEHTTLGIIPHSEEAVAEQLNEMGAHGWELIGNHQALLRSPEGARAWGILFFFKRQTDKDALPEFSVDQMLRAVA